MFLDKKKYLCHELEIQGSPKNLSKYNLAPLFCKKDSNSNAIENIHYEEYPDMDPSIDSNYIGDEDGNRWPS